MGTGLATDPQKNCKKQILEVNPESELHGPRSVRLTGDLAERRRAGDAPAAGARLEVVQDVGEDKEELGTHSLLIEPQVLRYLDRKSVV